MEAFSKELAVAKEAAIEAGARVAESYATLQETDISEKHTNDLVTVVDVASQEMIIEKLREHFPGDFIVAEESVDESLNAGEAAHSARRWFIDPLDGTTNYIHTFPMFAVSLALESDGELVMGVTYDPLKKELFWAVRGGGAFLNGKKLAVSTIEDRHRTLLGTGFPFRARVFLDDYLKTFHYFFNNSRGIRRAGSATLDLAYVAAGRLDAFWELTLSPWDIAAGVVLIEEAGGVVTDFFGGRSFLSTGHIVASNGRFHEWMLEEIERVFSPGGDYTLKDE
jgi:myo-inositol-1(or 4)-monophosphatase